MHAIARILAVVGSVAGCALMFTISADVLSRLLLGRSVPGLVDVSETLLVVMIFFGLAYGELRGTHIRISLLTGAINAAFAQVLRTLAYLVMAGWLVMSCYASGLRAISSFRQGEYRFGLVEWPLWPARWAIVIGLCCFLAVVIVRLVRMSRHGLPSPDGESALAGDRKAAAAAGQMTSGA